MEDLALLFALFFGFNTQVADMCPNGGGNC